MRDDGPGPLRVSQVAYAAGLSEVWTFRRAFRRRFGHISGDAPHPADTVPERIPGAVLGNGIETN